MTVEDRLGEWLPDRPLGRDDLEALEARDAVRRAATVRRSGPGPDALALGLQVELADGRVYVAEFDGEAWTASRYQGANLWWLRERRDERLARRDPSSR